MSRPYRVVHDEICFCGPTVPDGQNVIAPDRHVLARFPERPSDQVLADIALSRSGLATVTYGPVEVVSQTHVTLQQRTALGIGNIGLYRDVQKIDIPRQEQSIPPTEA